MPKRFPTSIVVDGHPDYPLLNQIKKSLLSRVGGEQRLQKALPALLQDAIDFVLDPVRTARTQIADIDNVEKTFIGLKVEHVLRDFLGLPKGVRDLKIDDVDIDVKNTVGSTWTIPPETYVASEPCLLIAIADADRRCWLGLIVAKLGYLGGGKGNRDGKRGVRRRAFQNILWIIEGEPLPPSRWEGIDMKRFRELRSIRGGSKRAAQFFRENLRRPVHRLIVQALLFDQYDYMKRTRGNGGARDILRKEGIALLSWTYHRELIKKVGLRELTKEDFMAVAAITTDDRAVLLNAGVID